MRRPMAGSRQNTANRPGAFMRILIFATETDWLGPARMPEALSRAGFEVGVLCLPGCPIAHTSFVSRRWLVRESVTTIAGTHNIIQHVINEWQPERILPGDDKAAHVLHNMLATRTDPKRVSPLRTLLLNSLGDPARYTEMTLKSALMKAAAACGVDMPPALVSPNRDEAAVFAREHGFPLLLKPDFGAGGTGILFCHTENELHENLSSALAGKRAEFTLQKFIKGQAAGVASSALRGRQLAALAYAHLNKARETGPSSVTRRLDRPDMIEATSRLIAYFGYNGFAGIDFMIEEKTEKAYLLEFNPRAAPMASRAHLMGVDTAGAYMAALTNKEPPSVEPVTDTIALFPQEWNRDPQSPFLRTAWHDVPWNDPPLLKYFVTKFAKDPVSIPSELLGIRP